MVAIDHYRYYTNSSLMENFSWYNQIEPEVRELVWLLRNNGINTTGSCGHERWILAQTCTPFDDMGTICHLLVQNDIHAKVRLEAYIEKEISYSLRIILLEIK